MNYKDINDKWKSFLLENTFKEDMIINPDEEKDEINKKNNKKKNKKKVGPPPKKAKELMTDPSFVVKNEWEEFENEAVINEPSGSETNKAVDSVEEEQLEEMSAMSGGPGASSVEGYAGGAGGSFMSKKAFKRKWS